MLLRPHRNDGTLSHGETCGVNSPPCHGVIDVAATKSAAFSANLLGALPECSFIFTSALLGSSKTPATTLASLSTMHRNCGVCNDAT